MKENKGKKKSKKEEKEIGWKRKEKKIIQREI